LCFASSVHDALPISTGKTYSDSTPPVSWGYDAGGYTGLKTSMSDAISNSMTYSYDSMNRLTQESRTLSGIGTFTTGYGYNIKGRSEEHTSELQSREE